MGTSSRVITINILVVDYAWSYLSPWLTSRENRRTEQDRKAAEQIKLFSVKMFTYSFPFWYIAFLKKYFPGGCQPTFSGHLEFSDSADDRCAAELKEQLVVFFCTHV